MQWYKPRHGPEELGAIKVAKHVHRFSCSVIKFIYIAICYENACVNSKFTSDCTCHWEQVLVVALNYLYLHLECLKQA